MTNISKVEYDLISKKYGNKLNQIIKKINKGYPIQYAIGNVNFFGYEIIVDKNVLIPRFETEQLVEETLKYFNKQDKLNILDLGTGSGCISIALKHQLPNANIIAIDKSKKALEVAKKNASLNETKINFFKKNISQKVEGTFDLIISNPPYISKKEKIMASVKKYEPNIALYAKNNGLYYYEQILNIYKNSLSKTGIMAFEIGCFQKEEIENLITKIMPSKSFKCLKDYSGKDRFIFIFNDNKCK